MMTCCCPERHEALGHLSRLLLLLSLACERREARGQAKLLRGCWARLHQAIKSVSRHEVKI